MKDIGIGLLEMTEDEFNSITLGNFTRRSMGWIKRTWITQREVIAAISNQWAKERITGEEIFPFGIVHTPDPPTESDREYMRKRHEHTLKIING